MKWNDSSVMIVAAAGIAAFAAPAWANGGSVMSNDTASFRLQMFGDLGSVLNINQGGNVNVLRGSSPVSLGMNINGTSNIMAKWDEIDNPNNPATHLIVAELWTLGKDDIMPFGIIKNNENFFFWTWNVGTSNPISFVNNSTVQIFTAKVQFIRVETNNAQTTLANKTITDLSGQWNGVDDGQTQTMTGQGMNMVRLTYEIELIPAPGVGALAGMAGLAATRRRRH